jgi:alpha-tubulin suppressor-like RCC1 family protein
MDVDDEEEKEGEYESEEDDEYFDDDDDNEEATKFRDAKKRGVKIIEGSAIPGFVDLGLPEGSTAVFDSVAAGETQTFAVLNDAATETSIIYIWGYFRSKSYCKGIHQFIPWNPHGKVVQVVASSRWVYLLTDAGWVYGVSSFTGRMQVPRRRPGDPLPGPEANKSFQIIPFPPSASSIVQVACGPYHSAALTKDGEVYAWGDNRYGQLGPIGVTVAKNPIQVPKLEKIKQIACGNNFTVAIDVNGRVRYHSTLTFII